MFDVLELVDGPFRGASIPTRRLREAPGVVVVSCEGFGHARYRRTDVGTYTHLDTLPEETTAGALLDTRGA